MGWKVTIKCDEEIWVEELEQIVEDLPDEFRGFIPKKEHMRQASGFPAYATIELPMKNTVSITGSYIMTEVNKSARFVVCIMKELKLLNHKNVTFEVDKEESICFYNLENLINVILQAEESLNENI